MNFIYPYVLWGLLAVSIPIIIHLFNFRRYKKVYFTNVKFLKDLQQKTKKRSELRHLLILLMRILAVASLVLAFAQPYIPGEKTMARQDAGNAVSVYIDNSFSMQAEGTEGPLLAEARTKARDIAMGYRASDRFQLLTNDFEGRHQRLVSRDRFIDMLDEVSVSPAVRNISLVAARQQEALNGFPGMNRFIYMISDFQASTADVDVLPEEPQTGVVLVPLEATQTENLFIDSCWFESPVHQLDQPVRLVVRIRNESQTNYEKIPLKLHINGQQKALASFDLPAGSKVDIPLSFTHYEPGMKFGTLEITDYPVVYDDRFYLSFEVEEMIPVLRISEDGKDGYVASLMDGDEAFSYNETVLSAVNYSGLADYSLIVLDEVRFVSTGLINELARFVDEGGSLLVIPPPGPDENGLNDLTGSLNGRLYRTWLENPNRVSALDVNHPVYKEVFEGSSLRGGRLAEGTDLPVVEGYWQISRGVGINLMEMQDGSPFLVASKSGKGTLYQLATPLDESYTNFPRHASFVFTLYNIGLLSEPAIPLFYSVGENEMVETNTISLNSDPVFKIRSMEEDFEYIPEISSVSRETRIFTRGRIGKAGHYGLYSGEQLMKPLSFNYDRRESILDYLTDGDINELLARSGKESVTILKESAKPLSETVREINQGTRLWKLFVIFALVFLGTEVVLLRFWAKT